MRYFRKLVGKKCYLSPINVDDAELYTTWLNHPDVAHNLRSTQENISLIAEKKKLEQFADEHVYAIVDLETDRLLGSVGLHDIDNIHRHGILGIFIGDEESRGKGYGREAIQLLLTFAFGYLNLHGVALWVFDFNTRGIACYRRVGFKEVGRRRHGLLRNGEYHDVILMDILAEELAHEKDAGETPAPQ